MKNTSTKQEYSKRIHLVQDYIEAHLSNSLTLDELAVIAGFSKFHFHRIFKGIVGESLLQYVNRIKLERAAGALLFRQELTITDIAYHLGFTDSAIFSRAFKDHYQVNPSEYRRINSKNRKDTEQSKFYNEKVIENVNSQEITKIHGEIETMNLDAMPIIYERYTGSYSGLKAAFPEMVKKLILFAIEQHFFDIKKTKFLSIFHDNHEFTDSEHLRTSLCMILPNQIVLEEQSDFNRMTIPEGEYAVGHFNIFPHEFGAAWDYMYGTWLINSSYQPHDSFPFEMYMSNPDDDPQGKQCVDIYIPIETFGIP